MATPEKSSDHAHSTTATSDSGSPHRRWAIFTPELLTKVRGVISVLLDIGRLIDRGLAIWRHYGVPTLHHT